MRLINALLIVLIATFWSCGGVSFQDQIANDLTTKLPSGICEKIPKGSKISNINIGEIVDIGLQGMTDVSYELDYENNGAIVQHKGALLYIKQGSRYKLASIGGCEYEMK